MAKFIYMPKLGSGKAEAVLTKWLISEGTELFQGMPIFEMEIGKMSGSAEAKEAGTLLKILHPDGSRIRCGSPVAICGAENDDISALEQEFAQLQEKETDKAKKRLRIGIIGGGPGGYVAAIRAAQLGAEVTLIEKEHLGGTCLNKGCIPTKALLHCASQYRSECDSEQFGFTCVPQLDFKRVTEYKRSISERLVRGVETLMRSNRIEVIHGAAEFTDAHTLHIITETEAVTHTFDRIIIASGSCTANIPIPGFELPCCLNSTQALELETLPESMVIVGGGVIGMEMAAAYAGLGTKITVVEAFPQILTGSDHELVALAKKNMEKKGVVFHTDAKVIRVEGSPGAAKTVIETSGNTQTLESQLVLVCIGRKPNTESLKLENAGITTDRGRIVTNDYLSTNVKDVYAIGDCTSPIMLAHVASAQAEIAAENAVGAHKLFTAKAVPSCIYMDPELASVGLTEEQARQMGIACVVGAFDLSANGKALIENGGVGMVKIVAEPVFQRVIGVQILGPHAADMITEAALAIQTGAKVSNLIDTIHPHPSVSEAVHEAALAAQGRAIHA